MIRSTLRAGRWLILLGTELDGASGARFIRPRGLESEILALLGHLILKSAFAGCIDCLLGNVTGSVDRYLRGPRMSGRRVGFLRNRLIGHKGQVRRKALEHAARLKVWLHLVSIAGGGLALGGGSELRGGVLDGLVSLSRGGIGFLLALLSRSLLLGILSLLLCLDLLLLGRGEHDLLRGVSLL